VRLAILALVICGPAAWIGWMAAGYIMRHPVRPEPLTCALLEAGMAYLATLMLAQALTFATQALYERNDLDLLLSSPLPPQRVLTVRALGVAAMSSTIYLVLASALVLPLAARGLASWLAVYVVILDLALFATALGFLLAMALFGVLGARRTRVVSQVLAALIGASVFLLAQSRNILPRAEWNRLLARLMRAGAHYDAHALYAWPARAVLGDPLPLLAVTVLCASLFWAATQAVGRRFAADAAAAAGVGHTGAAQGRRRAAGADRMRFSGSPLTTLARKDARLLIRDPWLISQMLLQLLYFVPLGFLIFRNAGAHLVAAASAPVVFLTAQLAGNLTWVVVSAEDAPELIVSAPVAGARILQAKLLVSLTPVAVLAAIPLAVLAASSPLGALTTAACAGAACVTAALMNIWYAKPADRRQMMRRRGQSGLMGVVETLLILAWAGTSFLLLLGPTRLWGAGLAIVAVAVLVVLRRPTVYRPALA
jgi:ABC-2 type transport system permease protein